MCKFMRYSMHLFIDDHVMEWEDIDEQLMVEAASKYDDVDAQQDFDVSLTDEQLRDALNQFEEERGVFNSDLRNFKLTRV
jgi:hypothetical protein